MARVSPASCNASPVSGPRCCNPKRFSRCVARSAIPDGATACSRRSPPCSSSSVLREVRYQIGTPGFRTREIPLVTTLLDAEIYRVADLAELYCQRWQVETSLAHLKTTMQMEVLHCKTVSGVLKELTVLAMVYNLGRMVMWQSATLQGIGVERVSFLDALQWLGAPNTGIPLGALIVNPVRPHRVEARVKKRRPRSFPFMITPRQTLRQQLVQQGLRG